MALSIVASLCVAFLVCSPAVARGNDSPDLTSGEGLYDVCLLQASVSLQTTDEEPLPGLGNATRVATGTAFSQKYSTPTSVSRRRKGDAFDEAPTSAWLYVLACCAVGPISWALATVLTPLEAKKPLETKPQAERLASERRAPQTRTVYLDLWRALCVVVMVVSHAGPDFEAYVDYNMLGGQQWVLPVVMLVAGTCFCKSSLPLSHYVARLLLYFSFGNLLNWAAGVVTHTHWWESITTRGVTFQMFFVLGLAGSVVAAAPVKSLLITRLADPPSSARVSAQSVCFAILLAGFLVAYMTSPWPADSGELQMLRLLGEAVGTLLLATLSFDLLPASQHDLIGWLLLAWSYATRIAHAEPRPGHEIHLNDLFLFAVFVQKVPLRGSVSIGTVLAQTWLLALFVCGALLHPGLSRRLDLDPPDSVMSRVRHYVIELLAVVAFTTIPTAGPERTLPLPAALARHMSWVSYWALFAYCTHYAIYRLILGPTWWNGETTTVGVVIVLGSALVFAAVDLSKGPGKPAAGEALAGKP